MRFLFLLVFFVVGCAQANTAETVFFLSDDLNGGIKYYSQRNERAGNLGFLFDEDFNPKQVMYARPENYRWQRETRGSDRYKQLFFPQTSSYAYLQRMERSAGFLYQIDDTHYRLTVDGSECFEAGCKMDENIVSVVVPKRFKVTAYDASVNGNWRVVDSTYTFYSRWVKGASVHIDFEDRFVAIYNAINEQMKNFKGVEVKSSGGAIQVVMPMDNVFDAGGVQFKSQASEWLKQLVYSLKDASYKEVRVEGHADSSPLKKSSVYASNWELSAARAAVALRLLIAQGVPPEKLAAVGYGDSRPIANNNSPEGRAKNRRIEFTVVPPAPI